MIIETTSNAAITTHEFAIIDAFGATWDIREQPDGTLDIILISDHLSDRIEIQPIMGNKIKIKRGIA
jgi:hypothetical protein